MLNIFRDGSIIQRVWFNIFQLNVEHDVTIPIGEWIINLGYFFINCATGGLELYLKLVHLLWAIWIHRNDIVFDKVSTNVDAIMRIFNDCQQRSLNLQRKIQWMAPTHGEESTCSRTRFTWQGHDHSIPFVIILIDGTWNKSNLKVGFGWLVRRVPSGEIIGGGVLGGFTHSAIQTETKAWLEAVDWAVRRNIDSALFLTDFVLLYDGIAMVLLWMNI